APPWLPGLLFGAGLFFHSTALLALPALLWLAFRPGPEGSSRARWAAAVLVPAALPPLIAVACHIALGFDTHLLRLELLESASHGSVLVPLTGAHGLLSFLHAKDLLNWIMLVV